jgi:uncharacterized protein YwqG
MDTTVSFLGRIFGAGPAAVLAPGRSDQAASTPRGAVPDLAAAVRAAWSEASALDSAVLTPVAGEVALTDSKIGGRPYLPPGEAWPSLGPGRPELFLLAQLNFSQLPAIAGFPGEGLLQFFIAGDDTHGMDYREPSVGRGHRVIFWPEVASGTDPVHASGPDLERAVEYMDVPFTVTEGVRLAGHATAQPMPLDDFRFESTFREFLTTPAGAPAAQSLSRAGEMNLAHVFASGGHRMGGYPRFIHHDPRRRDYLAGFTTLLLQLDSDESAGITWGDGGTGGFFIEPDRLAARDFSRVLYCWDCD